MRSNEESDWNKYKSSLRTFKKTLRKNKRASWRKFCTENRNMSDLKKLQTTISKDPNSKLGLIQDGNGKLTENMVETARTMLAVHFPDSIEIHNGTTQKTTFSLNKDDEETVISFITAESVRRAVNSFSPYKSPGPDKIYPACLQWGLEILLEWLIELYRAIFTFGYCPISWNKAIVLFLPKPGKPDYTNPRAFRPICLTSFLLKTLEKICNEFIEGQLLAARPIHPTQHAYRSGKSTESALHSLIKEIENSLLNKEEALTVFMDIEGAFDRVEFRHINEALISRNFPSFMTTFIGNLLERRTVQVRVDGKIISSIVKKGCPQGGVLSPLLWNLNLDSLLEELAAAKYSCIAYADDLVIIIRGKFTSTLCDLMQNALKIVEKWCRKQNLSVNPEKTKLLHFTKRKGRHIDIDRILLWERPLKATNSTKYLGLIIDDKLLWNLHLDQRIEKAKKVLFQCKRAIGLTWGLNPSITHWVYTAMVRPIVTYGSIVWWAKSEQTSAKSKLSKLQRLGCLLIIGASRSTPTAAMEAMLGLHPLDVEIKKTAINSGLRLYYNGDLIESTYEGAHERIIDKSLKTMEADMRTETEKGKNVQELRREIQDESARKASEMHKKRWEETKGCRQAKMVLGEPVEDSKCLLGHPRGLLRQLTEIITGHGDLGYHLGLQGATEDPRCRFCGEEEETAAHWICKCSELSQQRKKVFGKIELKQSEMIKKTMNDYLKFAALIIRAKEDLN